MKKEQTTTRAIHSNSAAKVQNFSELRKNLQEKDGIFVAAFVRREWKDGRLSYLHVIGRFAGIAISKNGDEWVIFRHCVYAAQLCNPMESKHGRKARFPIRMIDIVSFQILEDFPC